MSKVTDISAMFECVTIENLNLGNFDISNVRKREDMLKDAKIDNLKISSLNTKKSYKN